VKDAEAQHQQFMAALLVTGCAFSYVPWSVGGPGSWHGTDPILQCANCIRRPDARSRDSTTMYVCTVQCTGVGAHEP